MKMQIYKSGNGWRWRIRAKNGLILGSCDQGYSRLEHCRKMAEKVISTKFWKLEVEK